MHERLIVNDDDIHILDKPLTWLFTLDLVAKKRLRGRKACS